MNRRALTQPRAVAESSTASHASVGRHTRREFVTAAAAALVAVPAIARQPEGSVAAPFVPPPPSGPLADYVRRDDPATRFELVGWGESCSGEWLTGRLTSQLWKGVEWVHELSLFRPTDTDDRGPMLLWIDGGSSERLPEQDQWEPSDATRTLSRVAIAAGMPAAVVRQVPYQPMFDGLFEDGLIAHSFVEFARTGDPTWPLLLPMAKAAVEAMTAAETIAGSRWGLSVDGFVTTGASKRGWTTWLSAAVDERVIGFVPAVIDMLSMEKHVGLQRQSFGGMSNKLEDYTSRGIERLLGTPRGRELVGIVDPFAYRERLVQPKLIALGTNDPYWPLEACSLYYNQLEGPRWVSYTPNAGHGLPAERLGGLVAAMGRHVAGLEALPVVDWSIEADATGKICRADCPDAEVEKAVAWTATAPSRDFRKAIWHPMPVERDGEGWRLSVPRPADGYAAGLIELHVSRKPLPLILTSGVAVLES